MEGEEARVGARNCSKHFTFNYISSSSFMMSELLLPHFAGLETVNVSLHNSQKIFQWEYTFKEICLYSPSAWKSSLRQPWSRSWATFARLMFLWMIIRVWTTLMTHILHFVLLLQFIIQSPSVPIFMCSIDETRVKGPFYLWNNTWSQQTTSPNYLPGHDFYLEWNHYTFLCGCSIFFPDQNKELSQ